APQPAPARHADVACGVGRPTAHRGGTPVVTGCVPRECVLWVAYADRLSRNRRRTSPAGLGAGVRRDATVLGAPAAHSPTAVLLLGGPGRLRRAPHRGLAAIW